MEKKWKKKIEKEACKNLSCAKWVGSGFTYISEGYLFGGKKKKKKKMVGPTCR